MAIIYPDMYNHPEKYNTGNTDTHFNLKNGIVNINHPERVLSVIGGALLMYSGLKTSINDPLDGIAKLAVGGAILLRGTSGFCPIYKAMGLDSSRPEVINIKQRFTVNKSREEVYQFWRRLENLPLFMRHIESVKETDTIHSHWKAKFSKNTPAISWDAEIVKEIENHFIGWHSVKGSALDHGGKVEFNDAAGGGTELEVVFSYQSPIGGLGTGLAKQFGPALEEIIREDILHFKHFIETKEVPEEVRL
ncbi:SRPBCC family protein [Paradesertivirga mongoliensis]|uniref:SRPBCC family protein n=1 Tax=Paradesertivirga mongoliensis TaxID=2100740 RepID=A0ABW4ZKC8_9SPHI|nr:YgaP-like transmembrane domain [Pedobacter mongoliensis]